LAEVIKKGNNRIPSLDGFRAISIILVLIHHNPYNKNSFLPPIYWEIAHYGYMGVTIFFVISGLLITYLLLKEQEATGRIDIKNFYVRRVLRIFPVFFLYTFFVIAWGHVENLGITSKDLLHAFTFTVNFNLKNTNWFVGHFWSLSVEEQFYIFWPLIFFIFRKRLKVVLGVLITYSCIVRLITYKYPELEMPLLSPFFSSSDSIMIGAFGGVLLFENAAINNLKGVKSYLLQIISIVLILAVLCSQHRNYLPFIIIPIGNTIMSVSILLLILTNISPSNRVAFKFLNNKVIVHIGVLSYSIYVWQQFFMKGEQFIWRVFPFSFVAIYIVSLTSYYLWETQFLKLRKYFSATRFVKNNKSPV
jgi:peptidoglycan/LPS O-acetylase OafA/YrhL